jgi:hypothetical protein
MTSSKLVVDHFLPLLELICPDDSFAVYKEGWRGGDPKSASLCQIPVDDGRKRMSLELPPKAGTIQIQLGCVPDKVGQGEMLLIPKQQIPHFPELSLESSRNGRFVRQPSMRMNDKWIVLEDQPDLIRIPLQHSLDDGSFAPAEWTLKI